MGNHNDGGDTPDEVEPDEAEVGSHLGAGTSEMSSLLGDTYRGELDRETTWRSRLDQTTTWGVTVMAAILTWAFSSPSNPHYVILVAVAVVLTFLLVEGRRYRDYDVYRSRIRLFQQNLIADALDPSEGVEHTDWRVQLAEDYRRPTVKVSMVEAVANRLRRIYLALLTLLLVAWLFRITAFAPNEDWLVTAGVANVPGLFVVLAVGALYAVLFVVALWPRDRKAKGEFRSGEPGEWKESE